MFVFAAALTTLTTADVMFVTAAVALDTIVKLADTFLDVLPANVGWRVFMAAVAGEAAIVVAGMAGDTARVVVAIELEMLVVIKRCRRPFLLTMTLSAVAGNLLVQ